MNPTLRQILEESIQLKEECGFFNGELFLKCLEHFLFEGKGKGLFEGTREEWNEEKALQLSLGPDLFGSLKGLSKKEKEEVYRLGFINGLANTVPGVLAAFIASLDEYPGEEDVQVVH